MDAVGISGKDGGLLKCTKKLSNGEDIGYVGEIQEVNPRILHELLEQDFLPIIFPVGYDENYDSVSYTHLDVYKRQLPGCTPWS